MRRDLNAPSPIRTMVERDETADLAASDAAVQTVFSVADVSRLFDIPEGRLRYWSQTGFIAPTVREQARRFYCFQDLISVKVAKELLDGGQPLQRVRRSLDALRVKLPRVSAPLARLRIRSEQGRIVVEDGGTTFEAATGQMLLDFDVEALRDRVAEVLSLHAAPEPESNDSAYTLFLRAQDLEAQWDGVDCDDAVFVSAQAAYTRVVEIDPGFAAAWNNLGSLAAHAGDLLAARDHFDQALGCDPEQPEAQCNLAELALREGEIELAVEGFRQVLRTDPDCLEAHYGLARGLLALGGRGQALAHLERFCRAVDATQTSDDDLLDRRAKASAVVDRLRSELER